MNLFRIEFYMYTTIPLVVFEMRGKWNGFILRYALRRMRVKRASVLSLLFMLKEWYLDRKILRLIFSSITILFVFTIV